MLINDREIKNIHVTKVIDIARVAITNDFYDLDNIPKKFPPEPHRHDNATTNSDGFMSKEDYNKLHNTNFWDTVMLRDVDIDTYVKATQINDTFTLIAGKDIVFFVNKAAKSLTIAVDYTKEEAKGLSATNPKDGVNGKPGISWRPNIDADGNLTFVGDNALSITPPETKNIRGKKGDNGKDGTTYKPQIVNDNLTFVATTNGDTNIPAPYHTKGKTGDKGDRGITWRPYVSEDCDISYSEDKNHSTNPPSTVNVRGKCIHGYDGTDSNTNSSWDTLYGVPMGRDGQSLVFRDGKVTSDDVIYMGAFPNLDEEDNYLTKFNKSEHYLRHINLLVQGKVIDKSLIRPIKDEDIMVSFSYPETISEPLFLIDEVNYDKAKYDFVFDGSNNFLSGFKNFNNRPYFHRITTPHEYFNIGLLLGYTRNKRHNIYGYDTLSLHFYDNENLVYSKHPIFNSSQLSKNSYVLVLWHNYGQDTEIVLAYKCFSKNTYYTAYDVATELGYTCFQVQKKEVIVEKSVQNKKNEESGERTIIKDGIELSFGLKSMTNGRYYFINETNPDNPSFGDIFGFMNLLYKTSDRSLTITFDNVNYKHQQILDYLKPFFPNSIYFGIILDEQGYTLNNLLVTHDVDLYRNNNIKNEKLIKELALTTYPNKHNRIINVENYKSRIICNKEFYTIDEDIKNLISGKLLIDDVTNKLYHYNENEFINLNFLGQGLGGNISDGDNSGGNNQGNTEVIFLNNYKPGPNIVSEFVLV